MGAGSLSLLTGNGHKLVLHYSPFSLDVYSGADDLVVSMNSRQLLKVEHFRERKKADAVVADGAPQNAAIVASDEPEGFWSETYQSHEDSKPHGR